MIDIANQDEIDIEVLKVHIFSGIPMKKGVRPLFWRLILGALPSKTADWQKVVDENFNTYEDFKKELIVKP